MSTKQAHCCTNSKFLFH